MTVQPLPPSQDPFVDQLFQFRCDCGALLQVPSSAAGHNGTCTQCGRGMIVPGSASLLADNGGARLWPPGSRAGGRSEKATPSHGATVVNAPPQARRPSSLEGAEGRPTAAVAQEQNTSPKRHQAAAQLCSICQTPILLDDPTVSCSDCHLPFHSECWEANLGCSAYGCPNVNALRTGPDIQIVNPPALPDRGGAISAAPVREDDFPWEYPLLAVSALGALGGLLCFGIASLGTGAMLVGYFAMKGYEKPGVVLAASLAISLAGFVAGVTASFLFWW